MAIFQNATSPLLRTFTFIDLLLPSHSTGYRNACTCKQSKAASLHTHLNADTYSYRKLLLIIHIYYCTTTLHELNNPVRVAKGVDRMEKMDKEGKDKKA